MDDGFTWTQHRTTGGCFRCPNEALAEMRKLGWEPSEAPREPNPAVDERLAIQAQQEANSVRAGADEDRSSGDPPENTTPTQPRRGKSE